MDSCNKTQQTISDFTALPLSAKADDIVEASPELYRIIVILGGFRWIYNEWHLDMNTFALILDTSSLMDEIDIRRLLHVHSSPW